MMPAVFDRVVLDESMLEVVAVEGKMNLPMEFLPPFFPSELWLAFQLSMATAWESGLVEEGRDLHMVSPFPAGDGPGHVIDGHLDRFVGGRGATTVLYVLGVLLLLDHMLPNVGFPTRSWEMFQSNPSQRMSWPS
jgi:hypothetical protein